MQKQRPIYNRPLIFGRSIPGARKATVRHPKKIKRTLSRSTAMRLPRIEKRLSPIPLLLLISLRSKTPKNVKKVDKKTV